MIIKWRVNNIYLHNDFDCWFGIKYAEQLLIVISCLIENDL